MKPEVKKIRKDLSNRVKDSKVDDSIQCNQATIISNQIKMMEALKILLEDMI